MRVELEGMELECLVDTGFAGGILIPFPAFETLGLLTRLREDQYTALLPDNRRIPLFTSRSKVRLGQTTLEKDIHSSPELNRTLVGREFLKGLVAVLDGIEEGFSVSGLERAA